MDTATLTIPPRRIEDLPSPWSLPLLGNLHQMRPARMHQVLEHWAGQLGAPYSFRILNKRMVVWTDARVSPIVPSSMFRAHSPSTLAGC